MAVISLPGVTKHAAERRVFEVNLGPRLRPNDVIDTVRSVTADNADVTIDSISWTAGTCQFRAAGGVPGREYLLTLRFVTVDPPVQELLALIVLQVREDAEEFAYAADAPLSPWPAMAEDEAAAVARLCAALATPRTPAEDQRVRSLGEAAAALVERFAPAAPQPIRDEAVIRCAAHLHGTPAAAIRSDSVGPMTTDYAVSRQAALRHSGSMSLLSPWKIRRAGLA